MSGTDPTQSKGVLFSGLIVLASGAFAALAYFIAVLIATVQQLLALPASVTFDKGAFYLLGVFVALAALVLVIVYESVMKRPLTDAKAKLFGRLAWAGALIMIGLPHLVHFGIGEIMASNGYAVCDEASHRWLHSRKIVYTDSIARCEELAAE